MIQVEKDEKELNRIGSEKSGYCCFLETLNNFLWY